MSNLIVKFASKFVTQDFVDFDEKFFAFWIGESNLLKQTRKRHKKEKNSIKIFQSDLRCRTVKLFL